MHCDIQQFPERVSRGNDGIYRWVYRMNPRRNRHPLSVIGKVFFSMGALSAAALLAIGSPNPDAASGWAMPLMVLGMFLGVFLLITGLLYLQGDDPLTYAMDEESVTTFRAKAAGPHTFRRMRRIKFMPRYDAIRLGFGLTVYVPREDYKMVKDYILERLPENAVIR